MKHLTNTQRVLQERVVTWCAAAVKEISEKHIVNDIKSLEKWLLSEKFLEKTVTLRISDGFV